MVANRTNHPEIPTGIPVLNLPVRQVNRECDRILASRGNQDTLRGNIIKDAVHIAKKQVLDRLPRSSLVVGDKDPLPPSNPQPTCIVPGHGRSRIERLRKLDGGPWLSAV